MKRETISVPVSVALTDEQAWDGLDKRGTEFFVVRFHFQLNERLLDEKHQVGDWIGLYQSTKGMSAQHITSETTEVEQVVSSKCIESHLLCSETLAEIAAELAGEFKLPEILTVSSNIKESIARKLRRQYEIGVEVLDSQKTTRRVSFEIHNHYPADETKPIVSVPVYRRRAFDVLLGYIDFLRVEYRRSTMGLRKKCKRYPKVSDPHRHDNVRKVGMPIATVLYWELQSNSSKFMYEDDHQTEVRDPSQITLCAPQCDKTRFVEFPDVPTLYQIAKAAFPPKWIWRKSPANEWTEEELRAIEFDEVRATKTGWYRQYVKRKD
ncbi:MAG: hypothetical protein AAFS02_10405 [Pseudomonadota bacterium]